MTEATTIQHAARYVSTAKLRLHERNPRRIEPTDLAQLVESIRDNPDYFETRPILCNPDFRVFAGNMRLRAAKELGLKQVPVVVMDISEERQRELMIRDNIQSGQWQTDILAADFEMEELQGWGMPDFVFGLDGEQEAEVLEAQEDDFEAPEVATVQTDIVLGDLIEIGRHRLVCGDSTNAGDVAKLLNGATPNLMVTDPPYGVEYDPEWRHRAGIINSGRRGSVQNDDNARWLDAFVLFPGNVVYVWCDSLRITDLHTDISEAGFATNYLIIWNKQQMVFGRGHYHWKHEACWQATRKGKAHDWIGDRKQTTVWDINNLVSARDEDSKTFHGTQKPVECMARPVKNHAGDVYDPFLGSGTTMVAAHQLNRTCYGMEIDPKYCQIIIDRMAKLDPTLEIKINGKPYQNSVKTA